MTPTPEIVEEGLRAYERAKAFARMRTWRLPVSYAFFVMIPALTGMALWSNGYPVLAMLNFAGAILFMVVGWTQWKRLKERYAKDVEFLAGLKEAHGATLPWVQVENHFAELEKLKEEGER